MVRPAYPFEMVCTDYFSFAEKSYYIIVDRYSGWLSVYKATKDGATGLISTMKEYFSTFGIAEQVTSDEGSQYTSQKTQKFFNDWGISHRTSSSYFPHSNQRAEQGVKSAKRMIRDKISILSLPVPYTQDLLCQLSKLLSKQVCTFINVCKSLKNVS